MEPKLMTSVGTALAQESWLSKLSQSCQCVFRRRRRTHYKQTVPELLKYQIALTLGIYYISCFKVFLISLLKVSCKDCSFYRQSTRVCLQFADQTKQHHYWTSMHRQVPQEWPSCLALPWPKKHILCSCLTRNGTNCDMLQGQCTYTSLIN